MQLTIRKSLLIRSLLAENSSHNITLKWVEDSTIYKIKYLDNPTDIPIVLLREDIKCELS